MFDSMATWNLRIGPAVPSTGPVVFAYAYECGPECGNFTFIA